MDATRLRGWTLFSARRGVGHGQEDEEEQSGDKEGEKLALYPVSIKKTSS